MTDIRITRCYAQSPEKVWRAVTDPALIPLWTGAGRGGRPEGFTTEVGTHFRFIARPMPGWDGVVECEVLEVRRPALLRYSWAAGDGKGAVTIVTYRVEADDDGGTRFTYEHTGFTGLSGLFMARVILGPVRRRMLDQGLAPLLNELREDGTLTSGPDYDATRRKIQ